MKRVTPLLLLGVLCVAAPHGAEAHKVIAEAYASGDVIEGEIGFSNGDMAIDVVVEVFDDAGNKIGQTRTDGDGFFTFPPTRKAVHVFRANLGAGHIAERRLEIADLPPIGETAGPEPAAPGTAGLDRAERDLVAEMIRREIGPLRREIAAYKEQRDLQTILGGIGYIAGLFGIGFYVAGRRRNRDG